MVLVRSFALLGAVALCFVPKLSSAIGPYSPDANTLHLWHFNEADPGPAIDSRNVTVNPAATESFDLLILNGAHLGNSSFSGFGSALHTAGPDPGASGLNPGPGAFAKTPVSSAEDDVSTTTLWNNTATDSTLGAFTYEMIVKFTVDPTTIPGSGVGIGDWTTSAAGPALLHVENEGSGAIRPFQFALHKLTDGSFNIEYINISGGGGAFGSPIPAPELGKWYHAAVTYTGDEFSTENNLKFYWTEVGPTVTQAAEVGSHFMFADNLGGTADLSIANDARATQTQNWVGLMDEVRISDIARGPNQFIFANPTPPTLHPGDFDGDGDVDGADFVAWQTNFPKPTGATLAQGDADGDGDVDGADFVVWQTNFPFSPGPAASPVPEPSSIVLSGMIAAILIRFGRLRKDI
jgi:hypothetical protein